MTTVKEIESLYVAIDSFIRSNSNFESSVVINAAIEEIEQCSSLQLVFTVPLQHKLLTFDSALKWVLFLTIIMSNLIIDEDEETDDETKEMNIKMNTFDDFSASDAIKLIASVYDIGIQENVLCHIEDESDSESDSESESESDSESVK